MFLSPLFRKAVLCCLPVSLLGSLALADALLFVTNGGEYSVSGPIAGDQINASLAITTNGGFLVFEDNSGDGVGRESVLSRSTVTSGEREDGSG